MTSCLIGLPLLTKDAATMSSVKSQYFGNQNFSSFKFTETGDGNDLKPFFELQASKELANFMIMELFYFLNFKYG